MKGVGGSVIIKTDTGNVFKRFFSQVAPGPYANAQARWQRHKMLRHGRKLRQIAGALLQRYGWRVLHGPFAGMAYVPDVTLLPLTPKLVGSYEAELDAIIARILTTNYDTIVNVGCAEGYFAVGFALRMPHVRQVYAFDANPHLRALCGEMARLNGVADRVVTDGACDVDRLRVLLPCDPNDAASAAAPLPPRTLVVCDVDGYEYDLLRPDLVPGLRQCDLLVELHDCYDPRITPAIVSRFSPTHELAIIHSEARDPSPYAASLACLPARDRFLAVDEMRPPQTWVFATAKSASATTV